MSDTRYLNEEHECVCHHGYLDEGAPECAVDPYGGWTPEGCHHCQNGCDWYPIDMFESLEIHHENDHMSEFAHPHDASHIIHADFSFAPEHIDPAMIGDNMGTGNVLASNPDMPADSWATIVFSYEFWQSGVLNVEVLNDFNDGDLYVWL